jgi:hypothetical protein
MMDALDAFFQEHHRCGPLEGGVENNRPCMLCCKCRATFGEAERWRVIHYLERLYALPERAVNLETERRN